MKRVPESGEGKARRKATGSYYTPPPVARFICREALREYLAARGGAKDLRRAVLDCRVCDPAAGDGALLVAMREEMAQAVERLDRIIHGPRFAATPEYRRDLRDRIRGACLYGLDLQDEAVQACRRILGQSGPAKDTGLAKHILRSDSLLDPLPPAFAEVARARGGFDVVIMNPPYLSYGLRGGQAATREWRAEIKRRYPESAQYKISLYAVFMDCALSLARPGGAFGFLTPDSFLLGRFFSNLRARILRTCDLRLILMFERDFWKTGVVGRPVITVGRVRDHGAVSVRSAGFSPYSQGIPAVPRAIRAEARTPNGVSVFTAALCKDLSAFERGERTEYSYEQSYFDGTAHKRFRLFFRKEDKEFVDRMERGARPLGEVMRFASGLIGRRGQEAIVADEPRGPGWRKGIASGADVAPYRVWWRGKYLNFDLAALKSGFKDARYDAPKVMLRQTGDRLVAAYDPDGLYCLNNVHVGNVVKAMDGMDSMDGMDLSDEAVDPRVIVAILNSALMNRYYRLIALEQGRAMAQTDIDVIEGLPFKRPSPEDEAEIIAAVDSLRDGRGAARDTRETKRRLDDLISRAYGMD